jgi:ABC-type uncharacterized transport system auxiliary subunit
MKTKLMLAALAAILSLAAGCSGVLDSAQPARQVYMLMPLPGSASGTSDENRPELWIDLSAVPGLDTDWVQALGSDATLTRYSNARWTDSLPEVLASVLQRSLATSGKFSAVGLSSHATNGGWLLRVEIESFYGLQNADGVTNSVAVSFSGSIECAGKRHAFALNEKVSVGAQRVSSVVAAHQQGLNAITEQLLTTIDNACG